MPVLQTGLATPSASSFSIDQSIRFNDDDSAYLSRTAGTATSNRIGTISFWTKRGLISGGKALFSNHADSSNRTYIVFDANKLMMYGKISGSGNVELVTEQVFRDPSSWYHFVIHVDVTQSTASNRVKIYVNGSQITDFSTETYPAQDVDLPLFSKTNTYVGVQYSDSLGDYYDGLLSEYHYVDGSIVPVATLGETSSSTGQWIAKDTTGAITYGNNGFYLKFGGEGFLTYDRESEIAVTSNQDWTNSAGAATSVVLDDLVNGVESNDDAGGGWANSSWSASGNYVRFDFGSAKTYKNAEWVWQNSSGTEGSWKWQGSNNASDWTDIGSSFTLSPGSSGVDGTVRRQSFATELGSNTTAYRYYQILGISGSVNTSGRRLGMYFSETVYGLGGDSSGEGNNFTVNGLTWSDQVLDAPGVNRCTLNPLSLVTNTTLSEGNLRADCTSGNDGASLGTMSVSSGKWYWEVLQTSANSTNDISMGVMELSRRQAPQAVGTDVYPNAYLYGNDGWNAKHNSTTSTINSYDAGDIIGWALDLDGNTLKIYKNNSLEYTYSSGVTGTFTPAVAVDGTSGGAVTHIANFGADSSFCGEKTSQGKGDTGDDFYFDPPSGYVAMKASNLSPSISDPSKHFNTVLWSGSSSSQAITGVGYAPTAVWTKRRNATGSHYLWDQVRGNAERLEINSTGAEETQSGQWTSFDSDGFTLPGGSDATNNSGGTYVGWTWKCADSFDPTSGATVTTASGQRNVDAGMAIIAWTGTGSDVTISHGLGRQPGMVITKSRDDAYNWSVQSILYNSTSDTNMLYLNTDAQKADDTNVFSAAPTSSVISPQGGGWSGIGASGVKYISYVFAEIPGYSAIGKYIGNSNTNGPWVYTNGMSPAFIMFKALDRDDDWIIVDDKRDSYNIATRKLNPNTSGAEITDHAFVDFVSNGFKIRDVSDKINYVNYDYFYVAFASTPFANSTAR